MVPRLGTELPEPAAAVASAGDDGGAEQIGATVGVAEAAKELRVSPSTLRKRLGRGEFPGAFKTVTARGEEWRVPAASLAGRQPAAGLAPGGSAPNAREPASQGIGSDALVQDKDDTTDLAASLVPSRQREDGVAPLSMPPRPDPRGHDARIAEVTAENERLTRELELARRWSDELRAKPSELFRELNDARADRYELQAELDELRAERNELQHEVEALRPDQDHAPAAVDETDENSTTKKRRPRSHIWPPLVERA